MSKKIDDFEKEERERKRQEKLRKKKRLEEDLAKIDFNSEYELYMTPYNSIDHSDVDLVRARIRLDRDGRTIIAERQGYKLAIFQDPFYFNWLINFEKSIKKVED